MEAAAKNPSARRTVMAHSIPARHRTRKLLVVSVGIALLFAPSAPRRAAADVLQTKTHKVAIPFTATVPFGAYENVDIAGYLRTKVVLKTGNPWRIQTSTNAVRGYA
jgi:hypothetical protein